MCIFKIIIIGTCGYRTSNRWALNWDLPTPTRLGYVIRCFCMLPTYFGHGDRCSSNAQYVANILYVGPRALRACFHTIFKIIADYGGALGWTRHTWNRSLRLRLGYDCAPSSFRLADVWPHCKDNTELTDSRSRLSKPLQILSCPLLRQWKSTQYRTIKQKVKSVLKLKLKRGIIVLYTTSVYLLIRAVIGRNYLRILEYTKVFGTRYYRKVPRLPGVMTLFIFNLLILSLFPTIY